MTFHLKGPDPHHWRTVARHRTVEGRIRHQICRCGATRVLLGRQERWRSTETECSAPPPTIAAPSGWPHRKGWVESGLFRHDGDR
ncbi:hypothetical protein WEH80_01115 [Actinomycetes bacterium KLBMP 9759]